MSAGFKIADKVFWGTNGAVEACVEALADQATIQLGLDNPLTEFLRDERDGFYSGKVVFLDDWLTDIASRECLLTLLDAATQQLLVQGVFTAYGRDWLNSTVSDMRARIGGADRPTSEN